MAAVAGEFRREGVVDDYYEKELKEEMHGFLNDVFSAGDWSVKKILSVSHRIQQSQIYQN